jgi:hypothetical protein
VAARAGELDEHDGFKCTGIENSCQHKYTQKLPLQKFQKNRCNPLIHIDRDPRKQPKWGSKCRTRVDLMASANQVFHAGPELAGVGAVKNNAQGIWGSYSDRRWSVLV